jgi:hypothetical protein
VTCTSGFLPHTNTRYAQLSFRSRFAAFIAVSVLGGLVKRPLLFIAPFLFVERESYVSECVSGVDRA